MSGVVRPLMEKPVPETVAELIVNEAEPEFVSCTVWELEEPVLTFPKLTEAGDALN